MYEIYLTDLNSPGNARVADLLTVDSGQEANDICITLQGYLRDGIEAHFATAD